MYHYPEHGGGVCVCVKWGETGESKKKSDRASSKRRETKGREIRGRIAERPNCYLNQAAMKTSQ